MILTFKRCGPHAVKSGRFYLKTTIIPLKLKGKLFLFYTQMLLRYLLPPHCRVSLPRLLFACGTNSLMYVLTVNPLTPELNPSVQRWLTRFFTGDFAS
jgi:hypothetical protein